MRIMWKDKRLDLEVIAGFSLHAPSHSDFLLIILTVFGFSVAHQSVNLNSQYFFTSCHAAIYGCLYYLVQSTSLEDLNRIYSKKRLLTAIFERNRNTLHDLTSLFLIVI